MLRFDRGIDRARVEKALADDEAFLNAHPTRHCRHRPGKAPAAEIVELGSDHRPVPEPAEAPAPAADPDAALIELGEEFEQLLAIERPLRKESDRLWDAAHRLSFEKLGIDPDNHGDLHISTKEGQDEWLKVRNLVDKEVGYDKAYNKMKRASTKTARIGRKILR
jgi:hypothetical protein